MNAGTIQLDQGSGGRATHELVQELFIKFLSNQYLGEMNDSALVDVQGGRVAMTTDSYVVDPIFFPGGNIGSLAVHGTVNDLSMLGATPLYLTAGFILEEGLSLELLSTNCGVHGRSRSRSRGFDCGGRYESCSARQSRQDLHQYFGNRDRAFRNQDRRPMRAAR